MRCSCARLCDAKRSSSFQFIQKRKRGLLQKNSTLLRTPKPLAKSERERDEGERDININNIIIAMTSFVEELKATCAKLSQKGKGVLAADESTGTIGKRFQSIDVENVEENRRFWRETLFEAKDVEKYISGVILFEETLYAKTEDGTQRLTEILTKNDIVPGIKVDKGATIQVGKDGDGETDTNGMDGLGDRCKEYYKAGARFAKWRAVLKIDVEKALPSADAVEANAKSLARYAKICQENGLVPIVEPEIVPDGGHDVEVSRTVTKGVLTKVFEHLKKENVSLELMVLKPNMVTPGSGNEESEKDDLKVAEYTNEVLLECVPETVPAILFLSGGQSEDAASRRLNLMHKLQKESGKAFPWTLSYSYGRALQASALKAWSGDNGNASKAQEAFIEKAKSCSLASLGEL